MKDTIVKSKKILIIDGIILILVLTMFLFVKCRHRDAFTDKGEYKNISLEGTWYKVDLDELYVVRFDDAGFDERDMYGEQFRKGQYEVGNHALKLGSRRYSMRYIDEEKELEDIIDDSTDQYDLKKYFYIIDEEGNKIYYFREEEDAADQLDYNCQTNAYYEKTGMFDESGFAIDEEGILLAYNGNQQEVTIPESVTGIAENAFSADYDRALNTKRVTIPSNVKKIDSGAFSFSEVRIVYIENGVSEIEKWAFGDSQIQEIHFPENVMNMKEGILDTEEGLEGVKIYCKEGSGVDTYFKNNPPKGKYEMIYY